MIVSLQRGEEYVEKPHEDEDSEGDPSEDDWTSEFGFAEEADVPPGHEDGDGDDGRDGVQRDAEGQVAGFHLEWLTLKLGRPRIIFNIDIIKIDNK